jgi:hypothetical protein
MGCQHLDESYELCLLGTVEDDAGAIIREHIERGCPYCLDRMRDAARTVYLLSQPPHVVRPDPKRKTQLLRRIHKK